MDLWPWPLILLLMIYNLANPLHAEQFKLRVNKLYAKHTIVELTEKKPKRSIPQNSYLHLLLGFFAAQTGNSLAWVKREYYKKHCNADIYIRETNDPVLGKAVKFLRSSSELTTEEMTTSIERFRNWSAQEADIYLPAANESELLSIAEIEIERSKLYL